MRRRDEDNDPMRYMSVAACSSERWALMHIARLPAQGSEQAKLRACSIDGKKYA